MPGGGLAFFAACRPCRSFTFLPLSPRPPFPSGEGGDFRLFYARGFAPCIPGAEPGRRWLFSAVSVLLCPYPPTPFPAGRGRLYTLFRRGLTPPAPLRNKPARRWLRAGNRASGGGLGRFTRRVYFWRIIRILPPSPLPPFPLGEGGDFRLFYARGFAPCIPGAEPGRRRLDRRRRRHAYEPGRRWLRAGNRASGGGLVCFTRRIYFWRIIRILPLSPRPPSPLGKGETLYFISPGADAPGTPA